jgi:hypothetical protein
MFFIVGIRRTTKTLGQLVYPCSCCGKSTYHSAFFVKTVLTFFFIPLIPVKKKYGIRCDVCGRMLNATGNLERQLRHWDRTGELKDVEALPV